MKLILSVIFILMASLAIADPGKKNSMSPKDFISIYEKAISSQKWEMVDPLIHPDCVVTIYKWNLQRQAGS